MIPKLKLLALTLLAAAASVAAAEPTPQPDSSSLLTDEQYRTACGPIAGYVAIRRVGGETTLPEMIAACGWREGTMTPFSTLADAVSRNQSVNVRVVRVTPDQLFEALRSGNCAAILPIRKYATGMDHAVCAIGVENDHLIIIGYPELRTELSRPLLTDIWNGETIFITRRLLPSWAVILLGSVPGLVGGLGLAWLMRLRRGTSKRMFPKSQMEQSVVAQPIASANLQSGGSRDMR